MYRLFIFSLFVGAPAIAFASVGQASAGNLVLQFGIAAMQTYIVSGIHDLKQRVAKLEGKK